MEPRRLEREWKPSWGERLRHGRSADARRRWPLTACWKTAELLAAEVFRTKQEARNPGKYRATVHRSWLPGLLLQLRGVFQQGAKDPGADPHRARIFSLAN